MRTAGYDGVMIHAAHGYLAGQFLSPLTNLRDDAYGGTGYRRARFLYEITDAVRRTLPDAVVSVRLGAADTLPDENRTASPWKIPSPLPASSRRLALI